MLAIPEGSLAAACRRARGFQMNDTLILFAPRARRWRRSFRRLALRMFPVFAPIFTHNSFTKHIQTQPQQKYKHEVAELSKEKEKEGKQSLRTRY